VVSRSVTLVSPAKTAESIEMPFGLRAQVGPGNHVLCQIILTTCFFTMQHNASVVYAVDMCLSVFPKSVFY